VFRAKKLMVYGEAEDKHQSTGSNNSVGTCKWTDLTRCETPITGNISDLFPSIV